MNTHITPILLALCGIVDLIFDNLLWVKACVMYFWTTRISVPCFSWRHGMRKLASLLALCVRESTGYRWIHHATCHLKRGSDVFVVVCLNKLWNKQPDSGWFKKNQTLWRHCYELAAWQCSEWSMSVWRHAYYFDEKNTATINVISHSKATPFPILIFSFMRL